MTSDQVQLLRAAWDGFARGDVEAAVSVLDPEVRWYAADEPDAEGGCRSREDAAAFIRAALAQGVTAELLDVRQAGERLVAVIHMQAPADREQSPEPHGELVTFRAGKVTEMVVYPTVEAALRAADSGAH